MKYSVLNSENKIDNRLKTGQMSLYNAVATLTYLSKENSGFKIVKNAFQENEELVSIDLEIDIEDLTVLYVVSNGADFSASFNGFCFDCRKAYIEFFEKGRQERTYSQWINAQIISLT